MAAEMSISVQQFERSIRFIASLADLVDRTQFAGQVLPVLTGLVGCDIITYNELTPGQVRYVDFPEFSLAPESKAVFDEHVHEHPLVNHYLATSDRSPTKISDFLSRAEFHRLDLYQAFFRLIPVEHQIAITLTGRGSTVIGIALNRGKRDFDEADRVVLAAIRGPLAERFGQLLRRDTAQATLTAAAADAFDSLTSRETEVLTQVASGGTNAAIARRLDCSPRTVAKHLERVYVKLSVTSRAAAAARFAALSTAAQ